MVLNMHQDSDLPLDFLIIDSPPGTGDEPLTVAQLIRDAQALIVTPPRKSTWQT